jgi:hypothetical protein
MKKIILLTLIVFTTSIAYAQEKRDTTKINGEITQLQITDDKIVEQNKILLNEVDRLQAILYRNTIKRQELYNQFLQLAEEKKKLTGVNK